MQGDTSECSFQMFKVLKLKVRNTRSHKCSLLFKYLSELLLELIFI